MTETVECTVVAETAAAFLLRDSREPSRETWFPSIYVEFRRRNMRSGFAVAVIPLWLLNEKGWNE